MFKLARPHRALCKARDQHAPKEADLDGRASAGSTGRGQQGLSPAVDKGIPRPAFFPSGVNKLIGPKLGWMKRDEEQRLSIAIRGLLEQVPPDQPVRKVAVLKELGPKFDRVSIEELTDALARHCSALGRRLSNERDKSADIKRSVRRNSSDPGR